VTKDSENECARRGFSPALAAVTILALSGCTMVGPDYAPPETETPDQWQQALAEDMATGQDELVRWWEQLNDPQLTGLIARAKEGNPGLKETLARLRESRATRAIAAGEKVPAVDGFGGISRNRVPESFIPPTTDFNRYNTFYELGVGASWEVDFWGRVRRNVEAADAGLQGSLESYRDALVLLYGEVALTYTEVRALQARIRYIEGNIGTQRDSLQLVVDRNKAGIASDLEVSQAELNLYRTTAALPSLQAALTGSMNRLGVLLGESPQALHTELTNPEPIPALPQQLFVGVPGELVRRRPDIRAAERSLAAETARVGVATAELYPRFGISGDFSMLNTDAGDLFNWDSRRFNVGGFFSWNLFNGGRVRGQIEVQDARTEQALYRYEQTVLSALEEVETNLSNFGRERERRAALARSSAAAQKSVELVLILYRTGLTDFQNVLDMERSLFEQQDRLAASDGEVIKNLIRIYTSLGGGWNPDDLPPLD
jgi:NodT family efflux transporter outer membrane factor (OMF) lipoprotein